MDVSEDRWKKLFADLESRVDDEAEVPELVEAERVGVRLHDRLRAAVGTQLCVWAAGIRVTGLLAEVGMGWVRIRRAESDVIVSEESITRLDALGVRQSQVSVERSLTSVLRVLARSGAGLVMRAGDEDLTGRIVAVAADHLELRTETGDMIVPIRALSTVRSPRAALD